MKKQEYRFSVSDSAVKEFFSAQDNKTLSFRLIVRDAIRKYGNTDVVSAYFSETVKEDERGEK